MGINEERIRKQKEYEQLQEKKRNLSRDQMLQIRRAEVRAFEKLCLVDMDPDSKEMQNWIKETKKWDEARSLKPMIAGAIREQVYEEEFDEILKSAKSQDSLV